MVKNLTLLKKFPETYMRPEGAKTFKTGGMCRGAGAAVKGKKFQGYFLICIQI